MAVVLLLLGSNLGDRVRNIEAAEAEIQEKAGIVLSRSSFYESKAWGTHSPYDYINSACLIDTVLDPHTLLHTLHDIELGLGRVRQEKYGDRTIDIDIILYEDTIINDDRLTIPHPRMQDRLFVLVPGNQIASNMVHPIFNKTIRELLLACTDESNVYLFPVPDNTL